jgi:hypothetical protein
MAEERTRGIDAARTACCGQIPELVRGAWEPHAPNEDCRTGFHEAAEKQAARFAHENPHLVDDFSDADPGL